MRVSKIAGFIAVLGVAVGSAVEDIFLTLGPAQTSVSTVAHEAALECTQPDIHLTTIDAFDLDEGDKIFEYKFNVTTSGCYLIEEIHDDLEDLEACGITRPSVVPVLVEFCKGGTRHYKIDQGLSGNTPRAISILPYYLNHEGRIVMHKKAEACQGAGPCMVANSTFRISWWSATCSNEEWDTFYGDLTSGKMRWYREAEETRQSDDLDEEEEEEEEETKERVDENGADQEEQDDQADDVPLVKSSGPKETEGEERDKNVLTDDMEDEKNENVNVIDDSVDGKGNRFEFTAGKPGCYMFEEYHPELEGNMTMEVSLGAGKTDRVFIDQSTGYNQWNFLVSIEMASGQEVTVFIDPSTEWHKIRLTWTAASCDAAEAQVIETDVRMTAPFENIMGKAAEVTEAILKSLLDATGIAAPRMRILSLREGSVIAKVLIMPSTTGTDGGSATAMDLAKKLLSAVALPSLGDVLCGLVGGDESCGAAASPPVEATAKPALDPANPMNVPEDYIPAFPADNDFLLVEGVSKENVATKEDVATEEQTSEASFPITGILSGLVAAFLAALASVVLVRRMRAKKLTRAQAVTFLNDSLYEEQTEDNIKLAEEALAMYPDDTKQAAQYFKMRSLEHLSAIMRDGDKENMDDNASTITPTSDNTMPDTMQCYVVRDEDEAEEQFSASL